MQLGQTTTSRDEPVPVPKFQEPGPVGRSSPAWHMGWFFLSMIFCLVSQPLMLSTALESLGSTCSTTLRPRLRQSRINSTCLGPGVRNGASRICAELESLAAAATMRYRLSYMEARVVRLLHERLVLPQSSVHAHVDDAIPQKNLGLRKKTAVASSLRIFCSKVALGNTVHSSSLLRLCLGKACPFGLFISELRARRRPVSQKGHCKRAIREG